MKIIQAEHLGMCFGVRDAIAHATKQAAAEPITILGDLVHNETVLTDLRQRGIQFEDDAARAATKTVMITAHGASVRRVNAARELGFNVLEGTCPLVQVAHRALRQLVQAGFHPVIIGKRDHVEVRGLTEDLDEFDVLLNEESVEQLSYRPRFGIVAQTTQPIERVRYLAEKIRHRFPNSEIRFVDTVCQPTKQRQNAAVELAQRSSVIIVIGGTHSNNTHELVRTCAQHCPRVHHIQTSVDLHEEWFHPGDTVGITAGTSTPDSVIETVAQQLAEFAAHCTAN